MITINDKNLFVHYPKTGGTFVREVLRSYKTERIEKDGRHSSHVPLSEIDESKYDYVFATVRNPLDWYGSVWKFLKQFVESGGTFSPEQINPLKPLFPYYSDNFNQFVDQVLKNYGGYYSTTFFDYMDGRVDRYLKTETLSYDLCMAMKEMGLDFRPDAVMSKPKFGQRIIGYSYSDKVKRNVIKREMPIIDKFYL